MATTDNDFLLNWPLIWCADTNYLLRAVTDCGLHANTEISAFIKWDKEKYPNNCPCILVDTIYEDPSLLNNYDVIASPLVPSSFCIERKTSTSLLNYISNYCNDYYNYTLRKLRYKDGSIYYGTPGIVLNEDLDILIMMTVNISYRSNGSLVFNNSVCIVNPKVFENSKKVVEKYIINKIIPSAHNVTLYGNLLQDDKIKNVIIQNCNDFIVKIPKDQPILVPGADRIKDKIAEETINNLLRHEEEQENS